MIKNYYFLPILSSIFSTASLQAAPPTAILKVVGDLTVPVCNIATTEDRAYDLAKLSSMLLKASDYYKVPSVTQSWTVSCDADTYLIFQPVDNREGTSSIAGNTSFGLGTVNSSGKVGYYNATMKNATVDGKAASVFSASGGTFSAAATTTLDKTLKSGWASSNSTLKSGKVFVTDITVQPYLASTAVMNGTITDEAQIDGSMTLNFAYGI